MVKYEKINFFKLNGNIKLNCTQTYFYVKNSCYNIKLNSKIFVLAVFIIRIAELNRSPRSYFTVNVANLRIFSRRTIFT